MRTSAGSRAAIRAVIGAVSGAAFGLLAGCAGIDARAPKATDLADDLGFRYYETSPFLLMYTDGKGGLISQVLYLPDATKLRTVRPYAYGAKNDSTLKFEKGRLVQAKAVVDEAIIPAAVVSALEKVATASIKAMNSNRNGIPSPYLFRIVGDSEGGWNLKGGQALKHGDTKKAISPKPGVPIQIKFAE